MVSAAAVAAVAADTEPDIRTAAAADAQMVLVERLLQVTLQRSTQRTRKLTLLEQPQPTLNRYQHSRAPIRLGMKAK